MSVDEQNRGLGNIVRLAVNKFGIRKSLLIFGYTCIGAFVGFVGSTTFIKNEPKINEKEND